MSKSCMLPFACIRNAWNFPTTISMNIELWAEMKGSLVLISLALIWLVHGDGCV